MTGKEACPRMPCHKSRLSVCSFFKHVAVVILWTLDRWEDPYYHEPLTKHFDGIGANLTCAAILPQANRFGQHAKVMYCKVDQSSAEYGLDAH